MSRRHLRLEVLEMKGTRTSKQLADLESKRTGLYNQIQRWRGVQLIYMPCIGGLLLPSLTATTAESPESVSKEPAEYLPLHLPSSLPQHLRQSPELSNVMEKECRLRVAQADDALAEIRHQRRIISGLWHFKKLNVNGTGNKTATRMRTLYNRFHFRTRRCAARYRAARAALVAMDPTGSWQFRLKDLKDDDIRGPGKDDTLLGNSRFEPSWIWLVARVRSAPDMGDSEQVLDDSLKVEWSKSYARKTRWEEEVLIIQEEMRRVIVYHEWRAQWWRNERARRSDVDAATLHGIAAYAEKQAYLSESLARCSAAFWLPTLKTKGISPEWEARYSIISDESPAPFSTTDEDVNEDEGSEEIDDGGERGDHADGDYEEIDLFEIED
jgi:hypothetical protein